MTRRNEIRALLDRSSTRGFVSFHDDNCEIFGSEEGGYLKSNLPVASRSSPSARYNTTFRSTRSRSSNASSAPLVHRMSKETSIPSSCVANNNIDPGGNVSGMLISEKGPSPSEPS